MCAFMPASANWIDRMPRSVPTFEQRPPRRRRGTRIGVARRDGVEIQVREHDVEPLEEGRIAERRRRSPRSRTASVTRRYRRLNHHSPSVVGQLSIERRHDVHDLGDRCRAAALDGLTQHSSILLRVREPPQLASSSFAAVLSLPVARLA